MTLLAYKRGIVFKYIQIIGFQLPKRGLLSVRNSSLLQHYGSLHKLGGSSLVVMLPVIVLVKDNSIITSNG